MALILPLIGLCLIMLVPIINILVIIGLPVTLVGAYVFGFFPSLIASIAFYSTRSQFTGLSAVIVAIFVAAIASVAWLILMFDDYKMLGWGNYDNDFYVFWACLSGAATLIGTSLSVWRHRLLASDEVQPK